MKVAGIALLAFGLTGAVFAAGTPTKVTVRAISHDAKVIGTKVGGAKITIRDLSSGKVLAEGVQMGATGDTKKIIVEPHARGDVIYGSEAEAGKFVATLVLTAPTWVEVTASGALGYPQSTARASKTILLIPGESIEGEGILLEIHGFNVELLAPGGDPLPDKEPVTVRAKLTMT